MDIRVLSYCGLGLISLVFFANAFGIVDQARAERELVAVGVPERLARPMELGGRLLQFIAGLGLFFGTTRSFAALALAGFLFAATVTAHAFWKSVPEERSVQLTNFLKNIALIGGLLLVIGR